MNNYKINLVNFVIKLEYRIILKIIQNINNLYMDNIYKIYLISDSTGETLDRIFLALKAQFLNFKCSSYQYAFTRTENQITKIEGLDNLINLTYLGIDGNQIIKIEGLEKLNKLNKLALANNKIENIEGLYKIKNLQLVALEGNPIKSITKKDLDFITPLCEKSEYKEGRNEFLFEGVKNGTIKVVD